ncbi:hypothetical protein [Anaeromyxobacter sp. Fw109-5]|uniref:hypothetical protein n=1 Tax=Anaeromyxobacter sp. (strain Fw109-5) TaxID=404589 RepID=UPI0000ED6D26|nr:hypothetical protein [Anaeromyxobacter sp. Fw109-5]ABS28020.1 conserved hypothetical protein [Anaeromyxobacter sp. Fw109-5]
MANDDWTDKAAEAAARAAQRRETGGASAPAGGVHAPADVTIPGTREGRIPGREAGADANAPRAEPEQRIPGHRDEPEISPPVRGASAEEAPELLGERSDYPVLYGEDPGDIGS